MHSEIRQEDAFRLSILAGSATCGLLLFLIKFYWNMGSFVYTPSMTYDCFCITLAELHSCDRPDCPQSNIFTLWYFTGKVCQPLISSIVIFLLALFFKILFPKGHLFPF